MATYTTLRSGSSGDEVKKLQQSLLDAGYDVGKSGADGVYGSQTAAAVKKYQQDKGLDVDGVAGEQTLGSLYDGSAGSNTNSGNTAGGVTTTPSAAGSKFAYGAYTESDSVKQAEAMLQQQMANKPGEYTSPWQTQLNDIMDKIMNREEFSYDLNADALYQQYKDQYQTQGKLAMMDTMGQAAALTGGYGSSYGQAMGQQAYQAHLQQLNDVVPELYQLAYDRYSQDGEKLLTQYSVLGAQDEKDYGRHRDQVSDFNAQLQYLTGRYDAERDYDYSKYADERNFAYQQDRNQKADAQWQAEFDEAKRQYEQSIKKSSSSGTKIAAVAKVPDSVLEGLDERYGDNAAVQQYLESRAAAGIITQDQMYALYDAYLAQVQDEPLEEDETETPTVLDMIKNGWNSLWN